MKHTNIFTLTCTLGASILAAPAPAQPHIPARVEVAWDRYYTYEEIGEQLHDIAAAYPDLVTIKVLGKSGQGRDLWLAIVNNPKTGPDTSKPAMWIDGNVHGNEIQAGEAVVYSLWYLTKAYGHNEKLTTLLDNYSFYFLPSQNPDGRDNWFNAPNTPNSSRSNLRPVDDDQDGVADEDGPDDLDGDGMITTMWKKDPDGQWLRSQTDPRIFTRVKPGQKGEWTNLGSEGIDNDGDGQINEDGPGGDDMNRNWPSDWQPGFVQGGAGEFPLSNPEPRAISRFIMDHPNIGAVQSYHNAGGMILRGPGASYRENVYTGEDRRVYDEIGRTGEMMLPYYKYMIIYRDLYTVHGGFVNWTAEGLGIFSFTNEMWNPAKYFQRDGGDIDEEHEWLWRDRLTFGQLFTDYKEYDHPTYGKILIGGPNKWSARVTPTFMLEEECHRNFAFTMYHADQMPLLKFGRTDVAQVRPGVWSITVEVRNEKLIPTRSGIARAGRIGTNDIFTCGSGAGVPPAKPNGGAGFQPASGPTVLAAGTLNGWFDKQMDAVEHEPGRLQVDRGIGSRENRIFRFIVLGAEGDEVTLRYESQKAKTIEKAVILKATPKPE